MFINSRGVPTPRRQASFFICRPVLRSSIFLAEMFSTKRITFTIASFTALWSAAVTAYPYSHDDAPPNVALFNLPAAITPPAGEVLEAVYLGYGTISLRFLILIQQGLKIIHAMQLP